MTGDTESRYATSNADWECKASHWSPAPAVALRRAAARFLCSISSPTKDGTCDSSCAANKRVLNFGAPRSISREALSSNARRSTSPPPSSSSSYEMDATFFSGLAEYKATFDRFVMPSPGLRRHTSLTKSSTQRSIVRRVLGSLSRSKTIRSSASNPDRDATFELSRSSKCLSIDITAFVVDESVAVFNITRRSARSARPRFVLGVNVAICCKNTVDSKFAAGSSLSPRISINDSARLNMRES